ncbi:DUF2157 domain-containing protein [Neobacillus sp. SuZ13]|uniref:DUF2157 domain-containing protein n=1 Tax=Neobacillus sp. SuZ13 TaxID=3047875 RepID=UPI0024C0DDC4|nr:DUF2157 domain-containing protein [Neobacillus sp. SuZ13]WHY67532.1 DUF2157 domain-containing protein [Neobacillus sp. SuZ13]
MTKRIVKQNELNFLKRELKYLEDSEILPEGKAQEIEALYEVQKLSFTKTLLYVGSILIGAGVLSFIASNWDEIGKTVKFLLIIALFIACNLAGYKMEKNFPKTSKSLYYLGCLVFGAGIFLVEQMFHLGTNSQNAFLWWSLGILSLAWVLREKWILLASSLFVLKYMLDGQYLLGVDIPFWTLLWIAAIYILNEKIGFSKLTGFVTGLLSLAFIGTIISYCINGYNFDDLAYVYGLTYLIIGVALVLSKGKIKDVYVVLGYLVHGAAALLLSFEDSWPLDWLYIPFSILYLIYVLYLINRGSLLSIIILCVMIFRFYLDLSFEFLPKSFVFIIGGFLLLGFGFYFEKQRKKGVSVHE